MRHCFILEKFSTRHDGGGCVYSKRCVSNGSSRCICVCSHVFLNKMARESDRPNVQEQEESWGEGPWAVTQVSIDPGKTHHQRWAYVSSPHFLFETSHYVGMRCDYERKQTSLSPAKWTQEPVMAHGLNWNSLLWLAHFGTIISKKESCSLNWLVFQRVGAIFLYLSMLLVKPT